ncbi:MAG TPA: glycosyltransferase family 9 protein, partial [Rhodopila sp.]|nr:glycosyltransferase family 9 protein [Rhodopila sp.]
TYPQARITVVCGPVAEGVFTRMPNRERTIILRKQPRGRHWLPLWTATATTFWDLVVDIRGSALSWLVPTRRRAVFRSGRGTKVAQLGGVLGLSPPPAPVAWTSDADRRAVAARLPAERPLIAVAPTANWPPKVWPADRFAAVFSALARTMLPDAAAIVLGGPGPAEIEMAAPLLAALPQAVDLVGTLSLPEVTAVLERCALFIGNDSGLMHMAAAAGAPTLGLFGPTDATIYGPTGARARAVVGETMDAISVQAVIDAATALLRPAAI